MDKAMYSRREQWREVHCYTAMDRLLARRKAIEIAIRNLKTVLLEIRPVFRKTDDRIRAHVFLCMLADHVQWHMKKRLQPLFDHDGVGKHREWTFAGAIERLKAIRREKKLVADVSFFQIAETADDQQRILDLLNIKL